MNKQVLVIDDDEDIRKVIQISLERFAQWHTILAASGQEGIQKAKENVPDAILLDMVMPSMNGFECVEQLQADSITRNIPVIFLTAKASASDRQRFSEMHIAGIITKPFNPIDLCLKMIEILGWQKD